MKQTFLLLTFLLLASSASAFENLTDCEESWVNLSLSYMALNNSYTILYHNFQGNMSYWVGVNSTWAAQYQNLSNSLTGQFNTCVGEKNTCVNEKNQCLSDLNNCNSDKDDLRHEYRHLNDTYYELLESNESQALLLYNDCKTNLTLYKDYYNTFQSCMKDKGICDATLKANEALLAEVQGTKTNCLTQTAALQAKVDSCSTDTKAAYTKCNEDLTKSRSDYFTSEDGRQKAFNRITELETALNMSNDKSFSSCNEFMFNHYYPKWVELPPMHQYCLQQIVGKKEVYVLISGGLETSQSVGALCHLASSWDTYSVLKTLVDKGFVTAEATGRVQQDSGLVGQNKELAQFADYRFYPKEFPRGCVERFMQQDKTYDEGKTDGQLQGVAVGLIALVVASGVVVFYLWHRSP